MTECTTDTCDNEAAATVRFPESESGRRNDYCSQCQRQLVKMGVKMEGTYSPPPPRHPSEV